MQSKLTLVFGGAWGAACILSLLFFPIHVYAAAGDVVVPAGFQVNTVVGGLSLPVAMAFVPDGRIFVAQKSGAVRVVKNGQLLATPLLQLNDTNDYGDRGLEGMAIDPNFSQNGYIYLAYTYENTPGQNYSGFKTGRIVRFTVVGDTASLASKVVILGSIGGDAARPSCRNFATSSDCIPSDSNTHSMGGIHFGPDGKLYAMLGDGAGYLSIDALALGAQDLQSLAGKLVRLNPDGTAPSDNPFYDGNPTSNKSKVWSLGHRNSFRFSFRPSDSKLFFGDVGWTVWEEVNIGQKGANFGWPCREGFASTPYNCTPATAATNPIYVFGHSSGTASVMGGVFAQASAYPSAYVNNYFFGDYSNNRIKRMVLNGDDTVASVEDFTSGNAGGPVDFAIGADNVIYYVALNVGEIRKIVYSNANRPPVATVAANPQSGPSPLLVHFSSSGSSDPDGDPLSVSWNFGDGQTSTSANPDHTYAVNGTYTATLTVNDARGGSAVANATIIAGQTVAGAYPYHVSTSIVPTPVIIGNQETVTTRVRNDGLPNPFIVDMEIYNSEGVQVAQKVYDGQSIPTNSTADFTLSWLPPTIGMFTVKVGLFKQGWTGMHEWTDQAANIEVLSRAPTSTSTPPTFSATASVSPMVPGVGGAAQITAAVQNGGGDGSALIDIEVYKDGTKVGQTFYDNQNFTQNQTRNFTYGYSVPSGGTYQVSLGIFKPGWSQLYTWIDKIMTFSTAASGGPGSVYQNALEPGWENWSWGSTVNFNDTSLVAPGSTAAMKVNYAQAWAGLFLHTAGLSTAGKTTINFSIAGAGAGGQNIQLFMYDAAGQVLVPVNLSAYIPSGISANSFKNVSIPLADLGAQNKTITGIVLQDVSGTGNHLVSFDAMSIQ